MKTFALLSLFLGLSTCSSLKVQKGTPQPTTQSKPGISFGGPVVGGGIKVEKVGFWCDVKGTILTFGAFGPTQAEATVNAQTQCHKIYKDHPCPVVSCKSQNE